MQISVLVAGAFMAACAHAQGSTRDKLSAVDAFTQPNCNNNNYEVTLLTTGPSATDGHCYALSKKYPSLRVVELNSSIGCVGKKKLLR